MIRLVSKSVSSSDIWGVVTLAVFIGMIFTLAVKTSPQADGGYSLVVTSAKSALSDRF